MAGAEYVARGGELVYRPPFLAEGVMFYGFVLRADRRRLAAVFDRCLNRPSGGRVDVRPAGPHVVLVFCTLRALRATEPPDSDRGRFAEQEAATWLLGVDHARDRLAWFHPYIFVDNSYALAMGRELYGFPKSLGWFEIPARPAAAERFTADTLAVKTFTPETEGTRERLFEVRATGTGPTAAAAAIWDYPRDMMRDLVRLVEGEGGLFDDLELAFNALDDLIHGRLPFIFLKQFRDVTDPTRACYQSVVEVSCRLTRFDGGGLLPRAYEVIVADDASHPVRADLGLGPNPIRPVASFWTAFDFEIGTGVEV